MQKANYKGENSIFAVRLKNLMSINTTQQQLAEVLNVTRQTISLYLNGATLPPLEKLVDIANHFMVTTDYLLGLSDVSFPEPDLSVTCQYTGISEYAALQIKEDIEECKYSDSESVALKSSLFFVYEDLITEDGRDKMQRLLDERVNKINNQDLYNEIICSETLLKIVYAAHKNLIRKAEYDILTDYFKNNSEISKILQKGNHLNHTLLELSTDEFRIYKEVESEEKRFKESLEFSKWELESQIRFAVDTILSNLEAITSNNKTK